MEKYIFVLLILLLSNTIHAGRPLTTEDAPLTDVATLSLETGYDEIRSREDSLTRVTVLVLEVGLTERFCLGITVPYYLKPEKGAGSAELSTKFLFYKEEEREQKISLLFSFCPGEAGYTANLIATKQLAKYTFHLNVGYAASGCAGLKGDDIVAFAAEAGFTEKLDLVTEVVKTGKAINHLWGLRGNLSEHASIDFGVDFGLNNDSIKRRFTYGLTTTF